MKYVPLKEMRFIAKFGFLSRRLWEKYFSERSRTRNIRVWRGFVEEGYFRPHQDERYSDVLFLARRSKKLLEEAGQGFVTPANVYQISHDEKVAEIALKISAAGWIEKFTTESELKKRFTDWRTLSKEGQSAKFPDLLLYGLDGSSLALEVELSRKSPERYRKMMQSYSSQNWTKTAIFISDQQVIFDRVAKAMKAVHFPSWEKQIGFSYLKNWLDDPLKAEVFLSARKTTLADLLVKATSEEARAA
jgi:hypothetical protein